MRQLSRVRRPASRCTLSFVDSVHRVSSFVMSTCRMLNGREVRRLGCDRGGVERSVVFTRHGNGGIIELVGGGFAINKGCFGSAVIGRVTEVFRHLCVRPRGRVGPGVVLSCCRTIPFGDGNGENCRLVDRLVWLRKAGSWGIVSAVPSARVVGGIPCLMGVWWGCDVLSIEG